jgi:hypothetical protein
MAEQALTPLARNPALAPPTPSTELPNRSDNAGSIDEGAPQRQCAGIRSQKQRAARLKPRQALTWCIVVRIPAGVSTWYHPGTHLVSEEYHLGITWKVDEANVPGVVGSSLHRPFVARDLQAGSSSEPGRSVNCNLARLGTKKLSICAGRSLSFYTWLFSSFK